MLAINHVCVGCEINVGYTCGYHGDAIVTVATEIDRAAASTMFVECPLYNQRRRSTSGL